MILNLVMNSLEAIDSAATVERRIAGRTAVLEDRWAEVVIEDSGPGIPAENLNRLFDPFFTTKEAGMGMGLSIARSILESQGGRIWAENRSGDGRGARFRFTLPLTSANVRGV